jgi:hypothetical protein
MSSVVPIDSDLNNCLELIFEHGDFLPDDFYLTIMNLIKKYYENGNNFHEIHGYLDENLNRIDNELIKNIKGYIKNKNVTVVKTNYFYYCYFYCKITICVIVFVVPISLITYSVVNSYINPKKN